MARGGGSTELKISEYLIEREKCVARQRGGRETEGGVADEKKNSYRRKKEKKK